jgi:uncharacterized Zn finger protein
VDDLSFTDRHIRFIAAPGSYDRGREYLNAVTNLKLTTGHASATVQGSALYTVKLTTEPALTGTCDCPHGAEGNFCKHCVAVALTLLDLDSLPSLLAETAERDAAINTWLDGMSASELRGLLEEILDSHPDIRNRIAARAATAAGDVEEMWVSIADLLDTSGFGPYGFVTYDNVPRYVGQADEVVAQITALIAGGRGRLAVPLAAGAIELLAGAIGHIDDSSGRVMAVMDRLAGVHLTACRAAPPDPGVLVPWLLDNVSFVQPGAYAEVLGPGGLATLTEAATARWRADPDQRGLLRTVLRETGAVDAIVQTLADSLAPDGSTHLMIARELDAVGRQNEAREWAERGLREAGPGEASAELADYIAAEDERAGRIADVAALRRARFEAAPGWNTYRPYRDAAVAAGTWDSERPGVLAALKNLPRSRAAEYIEALVGDGDIATAWESAKDRATEAQWMRLADLVQAERPADALPVYRRRAEALRQGAGNEYYIQLVRVLVKMRGCHQRLGTDADFRRYVAQLRRENKRKRNLIALLDSNGL